EIEQIQSVVLRLKVQLGDGFIYSIAGSRKVRQAEVDVTTPCHTVSQTCRIDGNARIGRHRTLEDGLKITVDCSLKHICKSWVRSEVERYIEQRVFSGRFLIVRVNLKSIGVVQRLQGFRIQLVRTLLYLADDRSYLLQTGTVEWFGQEVG